MSGVFALDPKTLSFMMGTSNLMFALLATLYMRQSRTDNPALELWRWGRLAAGSGFFLNLASGIVPELVHPVLGNLLQVSGGGLDLAAYCLLLERRHRLRPLAILVAVSLVLLAGVGLALDGQGPRLLLFSAIGVLLYGLMAALLWRAGRHDRLLKLIAFIDALMALTLLARLAKGLALAPLVRFDTDWLTQALYLMVLLTVMINGFGFLLLAKQKDDRELLRAFGELAQADEDRRRFLAEVSHEFRTPLASIKASLDSLRFLRADITPEVARRLDDIRLSARRLIRVSDGLLNLERLEHPSGPMHRVELDLTALLREVVDLYPPEIGAKAELPEASVPLWGDPLQLRIAVRNLIDNAVEHNSPESGAPVLSLVRAETWLEIRVADQGTGIPDQDKAQLFSRFYNRRGEFARGLGLAIVQRVAQQHGGELLVRDNRPQGTLMVLRLPADRSKLSPTESF
ncbi:MAG: HAMP domain-containing histidine kinase [Chromatiales bacterium]|nr:HAMP domain-containing histidine kinase [Chromatiales bacterium]